MEAYNVNRGFTLGIQVLRCFPESFIHALRNFLLARRPFKCECLIDDTSGLPSNSPSRSLRAKSATLSPAQSVNQALNLLIGFLPGRFRNRKTRIWPTCAASAGCGARQMEGYGLRSDAKPAPFTYCKVIVGVGFRFPEFITAGLDARAGTNPTTLFFPIQSRLCPWRRRFVLPEIHRS